MTYRQLKEMAGSGVIIRKRKMFRPGGDIRILTPTRNPETKNAP